VLQQHYLGYALVLAIVASAIGDLAWFWAGRCSCAIVDSGARGR